MNYTLNKNPKQPTKLLLLILAIISLIFITALICPAQVSKDSSLWYNGKKLTLIGSTLQPTYSDTTKVKILIGIGKSLTVIFDYQVHQVGYGYSKVFYLHSNKTKLPKEVEVWISKEIE